MTQFSTNVYYKCRSCDLVFVAAFVSQNANKIEDCKLRTHGRDQLKVTMLPSLHRLDLVTVHQCTSSVTGLADLVKVRTYSTTKE